ncbi:MAG: GNAT family N-acetyltransferase [Burkholderiales bacterium]|nr:MAG: GNAT family N-acetyltransferase [Burkholderiales bacterium]
MTREFDIRAATREDAASLLSLIRALAVYEKLEHLCIATEADLRQALFGAGASAEALVARDAGSGEAVGFALFFHNFSTFLGRRGLYLEDLFVEPQHRRRGIGKALLQRLAAVALERGCGRFEWSVLDWNQPAIEFYRSLGAIVMPDWRIVRMTGPALERFARDMPR